MNSISKIFKDLCKYINYLIILHITLFTFSNQYIIKPIDNAYPKIKDLPSGEYFIIMSNGIYISNNDFSNIIKIFKFNNDQSINSIEDNNKTALSEFKNDTNFYILSLVKNYLYLFDFNKRNISQFDLRDKLNGNFYNLIPYKIFENALYYVIVFSETIKEICKNKYYDNLSLRFINYRINFFEEKANQNIYIISYNYKNLIEKKYIGCYSYISNLLFHTSVNLSL